VSREPKRPEGVPAKARWVAEDNEWELGTIDAQGRKQGAFTYWRPDGTKVNECVFKDGAPHGPFKRFHENGEVSQDGEFQAGQLHGTRRWFACDAPTTERMHEGGVSEKVRRSEMDYVKGRVVGVRHFDAQGRRVAPNGEPYPDRPATVEAGAEFRPDEDMWTKGEADAETAEREGTWRIWTRAGELEEESTWSGGEREGPATLYLVGESPFSDQRVVAHRGAYVGGLPSGSWQLLDAKGGVVRTVDFGDPHCLDDAPRLEAFADVGRPAAEWKQLAQARFGSGAVAEGLCLLARAAAAEKSAAGFLEALASRARPAKREVAAGLAEEAESELPVLGLALLRGAEPSAVLRKMAVVLDQKFHSRAALDFVNAALLVSPASTEYLFTRALVLMSLGLNQQAERDASELASSQPEQAEFLLDYLRFLFPRFDFWPAREKPETYYSGLPERPARELDEVRAVAQKYATRLSLLRERMLQVMTTDAPWLVPDLTALLPDGPVPLESGSIEPGDDAEEDAESIDYDETLDVGDADVPTLVRLARADWNALAWLCWSAGLDRVALPETLSPPKDFDLAAGMSAQRLWRARDQRLFGGRNARAQNIASFQWEGADVGELHPNLASIAEQQYAEMKALFLWLSDAAVKTPWQDGLRGS